MHACQNLVALHLFALTRQHDHSKYHSAAVTLPKYWGVSPDRRCHVSFECCAHNGLLSLLHTENA